MRRGVFRGDGAKGQYCVVMPKQDMVVAMTAGLSDMNLNLEAIWDCLLPGVQDEALCEEEAEQAVLHKLQTLQIPLAQGEKTGPAAQRWQGNTYAVGENALGIDRLSFAMEENGVVLTLARGAQVFSIKAGYQGWFQNHLAIPDWQCTSGDYFDAQVGACYAINGDTLDIKLSFVRTTLCETFNFRFAENGFFAKVDILPDHETHTLAGVVL